jgi:hypothetical protein
MSGSAKNVIPEYAAPLLERLTRLRVCTAPQAHLLTPAFARRSLRNVYHRLITLVRNRWLVMDAVSPTRGAATPHFYRLSHQALRALGLESKVGLLQRPAQHVLEYLLLRAEVYARARAAGWYVGSPVFLAPSQHAAALHHFHGWLKGRALERYKSAQQRRASPAQLADFKAAIEQLPRFLPTELGFEFLYRADREGRVSQVVLLLVDDVRRSVVAQVDALPLVARADCPVLIRDCDSVWNPDTGSLHFTGARLLDFRRALARRFGEGPLSADAVLPAVWARSTRSTPQPAVQPSTVTQESTP